MSQLKGQGGGVILLGVHMWRGVSSIWKLKGHLFRSGHLIVQEGGWILINEIHSPGFESTIFQNFSKNIRLQRAFNQLLVIIAVTNFSNVKNTISLDDETQIHHFLTFRPQGRSKFYLKFSRSKGGCQNLEIQEALFVIKHKNSGGFDTHVRAMSFDINSNTLPII